jgi:acyl-CoA thioesterase
MNREAQVLERVNNPNLFNSHNGITVTAVGDGKARGVLEVSSTSLNPHGTVHGGCLYTLADTVAGSAVATSCGGPCVTVSGTLEFLRPATGEAIYCTASPKKLGGTICTMQVELTDQAHKVVATGTFIFMLVQPKV